MDIQPVSRDMSAVELYPPEPFVVVSALDEYDIESKIGRLDDDVTASLEVVNFLLRGVRHPVRITPIPDKAIFTMSEALCAYAQSNEAARDAWWSEQFGQGVNPATQPFVVTVHEAAAFRARRMSAMIGDYLFRANAPDEY